MADIIIAKRLIDFVGLNVKGSPESYQRLFKDVALVLALNEAMGPDGAVLMNANAFGDLRVGLSSIGASPVANQVNGPGYIPITLYDATANPISRASAGALIAEQSNSAILAASPGEWAVESEPATGSAASASRAAGAAGVRHVCRSFAFSWGSAVAPAATAFFCRVRDGASGAGAILFGIMGSVQAVAGIPGAVIVSGLNLVGSAATAMTAEMSTGVANVNMIASISGYDGQP